MRKLAGLLIVAVAVTMMMSACNNSGKDRQEYSGTDAVAVREGGQWTITGPDGRELVTDYDSMRVAEVGEDGHPATVLYFKQGRQTCIQLYSNMALRCRGDIVDGQRDGEWRYYFADGTPQAEATFVAGREDGPYRVYRENGMPYYIGQYKDGVRTGTWEVYDPEGNLVQRQEY